MKLKTLMLAATCAVPATLVYAAPAAAQAKLPTPVIAIIDAEKVLTECTACKAADAQLQAQQAQLQQFAQQLAAPLQTEGQALRTAVNAANGKPDAALQTRITVFEGKQQTAQSQIQAQQDTLQRNAQFVRQQEIEALKPLLDQVSQQRGATVTLDRSAVLFAAPTIDVTNDVLAGMNAKLQAVNVVAPPPPPQGQAAAPAGTTPAPKPPGR